jgi:two-component system, OmpR family, sensor kinase
MKRALQGSLALRLVAVGVAQLVLVALAAVAIGQVVSRLTTRWDIVRVEERLKPFADKPHELTREFALLRADGVSLSLYDEDEKLVASNVSPPLRLPMWRGREPAILPEPARSTDETPPPPGMPPVFGVSPLFGPGAPPLTACRSPELLAQFDMGKAPGLLVARFDHPRPSNVPPLLTLAAGLVVMGVGALLTARWIMRPLHRLALVARALGAGNLRARSHLRRGDVLGEVGEAFDDMARRIEELLVAERELLANVSHELRTPLARIRVALDLAVEGDAAAAKAFIQDIAVELSELEALLSDVLDAARLELADGKASAPGFPLHLDVVAPQSIGVAASERFRARHPARRLEVSLADGLPPVEVDPMLFRRVIDNLLENAHKYSPDETLPIRLEVDGADGAVRFAVVDRGMGVAGGDLPRIFTAFFRGDRSRSRGTGGVGLGLTLAKRIVEAHHGSIDVTSAVGSGTTVRVALPVASL